MQIYLRKSCKKVRFCGRFCKNGRFLGDLCLCISKKSSNFAPELRWWAKLKTIINNFPIYELAIYRNIEGPLRNQGNSGSQQLKTIENNFFTIISYAKL